MAPNGAGDVFDDSIMAMLEAAHPLIIATTSTHGEPHASRAWGITEIDRAAGRIRLLLDADDSVAVSHAASGGEIAVTSADVRTLRALQLKGVCTGVESATVADRDACARFIDQFAVDVEETDGTPRDKIERITPREIVATIVLIRDLFNQTPGPKAGEALSSP